MGRILSAKSDLIFKRVFGDVNNTDILASFLEATLRLEPEEYDRLELIDTHLNPKYEDDKLGILDVKVHTVTGRMIDIEIQVLDVPKMRDRIVYYVSRMLSEQLKKGQSYDLNQVISIVITDYVLISENDRYHNVYQLYDKQSDSTFTDLLEVNTLELPKLKNKAETDNHDLWNWMKFINAESEEEFSMLDQGNENIRKAVGIVKQLSSDEQTRLEYDLREKAKRDYYAGLYDSKELGRQEGIIEGRQEGLREGELKGKREGLREGKIDMARKALLKGFSVIDVSEISGLSVSEIERLTKNV